MKILHVTNNFILQSAGYRLHKGLINQGIDSRILTGSSSIDDPFLIQPIRIYEKGASILKRHMDQYLLKMYPNRTGGPFSPAIIPDFIIHKIKAENPSLVHLHWICGGFIQIESLKKIKYPIVWTLHDSWPFTGGCHIPYQCQGYYDKCGKCSVLGSTKIIDLSRFVWLRKKYSWKNKNFLIIPVSNWLADCVRKSSLFSKQNIEVIHNGINTNQFKPIDKILARNVLNIPLDKKIILFGAVNSTSDPNKGFQYLDKALKKFSEFKSLNDIEIIIFGGNHNITHLKCGINLTYFGRIYDDTTLILLYASADVFVAPSLSETLSNTIMESLACGTPAVAFRVGGIPELIEHERNGYLAQPFDPIDLAKGIDWVISNEENWHVLSHYAREKILKEFDIKLISKKYIDLYLKALENKV